MLVSLLILSVVGILGGILAGMLGIGGGIVYILALEFYLPQVGVLPHEVHQFVIANSLFAVFFASISSCYKLIQLKTFYVKQTIIVASGGILASFLTLRLFVNTPYYSKTQFDLVVLIILSYMLFRVIKKVSSKELDTSLNEVPKRGFILSGIAGSIIASLSGMGGGVVMIPIFTTVLKIDIKTARSISLGVITITAGFMSINNLLQIPETALIEATQFGYIIPQITFPIIGGVLLGGQLGVSLSKNMKASTVSIIYGIFLSCYIIIKTIELL